VITRSAIIFFIVLFGLPVVIVGQGLNGQMGYEGPDPSTRINTDADKSIIHVTSRIPNLRFDSNRGILKVVKLSSGDWDVLVSPGTHIFKIVADDYESLVLPPFNYQKLKLYEIRVSPKIFPQKFGTTSGRGSLYVDTDPSGSKLVLPDMEGEWTTPKHFKSIRAGIWTLIFTHENYDTLITEIMVNKDSVVHPPPFKLSPSFGAIAVRSSAAAQIFIDGLLATVGQNYVTQTKRGSHDVVLRKNHYDDYQVTVEVGRGDTAVVDAELVPKFGFFEFTGLDGATIWLDSRLIGGIGQVEADTGMHRIRITHPRIGDQTKMYSIAKAQTTTVRASDFEEVGILNISTDVLADISIDGKIIGQNAATQNVMPGNHVIDINHPSLGRKSMEASIYPGQRSNMFISMRPVRSTAYWLMLLPGANQLYKKQTTRGYLYAGAFAVSAGASAYFLLDYLKKKNDYDAASAGYRNATLNAETAKYREQIESLYDGINTDAKMRNTSLIAAGAVYVLSFVDALIFPPEFGYRGDKTSGINVGLNSIGDGIKFEFSMGL